MSVKNLHNICTKYFADSVEWCNHPEHPEIFACGTYQLDDTNSNCVRRKGSIVMLKFIKNEEDTSLCEVFEKDSDGILDQKWLKGASRPLLAAATSSGRINLYSWEEQQLTELLSYQINAETQDNIALSLDWNRQSQKILVSDSKGCVSVLNLDNYSTISRMDCWKAHSFEAWTCAFDKNNPNIILTGGDDCFCKIYDLRDTSKAQNVIKTHEAGVTSLLSFEKNSNYFCTGSYDENLRLFDWRSPKSPINSTFLSGGIWRLKGNPFEEDLVACACMYQNFTVCRINFQELQSNIEATFNGDHKSICYGIDWCPVQGSSGKYFFGACSFYDNLLTVNSYSKPGK
ncbi:diphthine methyltransferase [Sergentomyia squamirostris]